MEINNCIFHILLIIITFYQFTLVNHKKDTTNFLICFLIRLSIFIFISSWSEEVDTEDMKMDCSESDALRKRKWDCDGWKTVQAEDRKSDQATYGEVCCVFFMVYQCKLVKYDTKGEEESTEV